MKRVLLFVWAALLAACPTLAYDWDNYDVDDWEEDAGTSASIELNPADGIYGVSGGDGTWLTGTPVFGDFFITLFYNDIEEALYSGVGLTLRIMPHWEYAPFVGAGGSYNLSLARDDNEEPLLEEDEPDKGESYWGGHVEAGLRISGDVRFFELGGRYTSTSSDLEDADYWLGRISYGFRMW